MVKTNTTWGSSDGRKFLVNGIMQQGPDTWIHYINVKTNQQYSCLVDAFVQRFREEPNDGR